MKRFVVKSMAEDTFFRSDNLRDCVDYVRNNDPSLNLFYIEDLEDQIEVCADEILLAFDNGECYEDLQAF